MSIWSFARAELEMSIYLSGVSLLNLSTKREKEDVDVPSKTVVCLCTSVLDAIQPSASTPTINLPRYCS